MSQTNTKFAGKSLTSLCVERNAIKRDLYLNGHDYKTDWCERKQYEIDELQAEIDRREREGLDERLS